MIKMYFKFRVLNIVNRIFSKDENIQNEYSKLSDKELLELLLEHPEDWKFQPYRHDYGGGSYLEHTYTHVKYKVKIGIDYSPFGEFVFVYINNFKNSHDLSYDEDILKKIAILRGVD